MISKGRARSSIVPIIKGASLLVIGYYLYSKLSVSVISDYVIPEKILFFLPILLLLSLLNWSLEALKWQVLTTSISKITFQDSFRGVLSGLSLSMIVPIGLGDKIGRLGYIKTAKKIETISLGYLGGLIQFLITLSFGIYGIFHLVELGWSIQLQSFTIGISIMILTLVLLAGAVWLFLRETIVHTFLARIVNSLKEVKPRNLLLFISLATLRYSVFAFQLFILFKLMDLGLSGFVLFAGITWIFFSKTVIPAFNFLSDLGIREFSAVLFFSFYHVPAHDIILPTLLLWLINIFIPSILGMYFIARVKLSTQTQVI